MGNNQRRFTEEEKQIILAGWWDLKQRSGIINRLNRTNASIRIEYYKLLRKKSITPDEHKAQMKQVILPETITNTLTLKPVETKPITNEAKIVEVVYGEDVDHRLDDLETKLSTIEKSLVSNDDKFVTWLENILYMYKQGENALSMSLLMRENQNIKERISELLSKVARLESQLIHEKEYHEKVYLELDFWLGQYFKLSSVEKIATLQDFVPKLKTIVDKYGTVLNIATEETRKRETFMFAQK